MPQHPSAHGRELSPSMHTFGAFHQTVLAYRQLLMRGMAEHGLHPGQAFAVAEISHREGLTQAELAESLGVSRPTVTVMLQKLEKAGAVERRSDPEDQRFTRLYLTDEGRARYGVMHSVLAELTDTVFAPMSGVDRTELTRLLGVVTANIQSALAEEATADDEGPTTEAAR